jgi:integrase
MKRAIDDQWILSLPTQNLRPLKWTPRKRDLVPAKDIDRLCQTALVGTQTGEKFKNGRQFADYVKLMAYCGSRRGETLRLKWSDVSWPNRQLTIGADGLAKNRKTRMVDFSPKLEAHLQDMQSRRAPDSDWLFPSPQRGEEDKRARSFVETMRLVRQEAQLPPVWLSRLPALLHLHVRHVGHRLYDHCPMGGAPGRGHSNRQGLRAPLGRARPASGTATFL